MRRTVAPGLLVANWWRSCAIVILYFSVFVVSQTQQALVLRFGQVVSPVGQPLAPITKPGLYYKLPLIDNVVYFEKRILDLDSPPLEIIASDQKRLVVDAFGRYRIVDPLLFYQSVGNPQVAQQRLSVVLNSAVRRVLGDSSFIDLVRDRRAELMGRITQQVDGEAQGLGVDVVDVRIRSADLPAANSQAIYQRMQTERQLVAAQTRAQGDQAGRQIRAEADRQATVIVAEANGDLRAYAATARRSATRSSRPPSARTPTFSPSIARSRRIRPRSKRAIRASSSRRPLISSVSSTVRRHERALAAAMARHRRTAPARGTAHSPWRCRSAGVIIFVEPRRDGSRVAGVSGIFLGLSILRSADPPTTRARRSGGAVGSQGGRQKMADMIVKGSRIALALAAGLATAVMSFPAGAVGPASVADLAGALLSAVVTISTSQVVNASRSPAPTPQLPDGSPFQDFFNDFFNQQGGASQPRRVQSLGSGFVIDPSGIIVTNNHVIEDADEITVNFTDGSKATAKVLGIDDKTDIAVLKVSVDHPLPAVSFGDSTALRVGDWVMAIGNPFGLGGTVTVGIVSARNRDINSGPVRRLHPDRRRHQQGQLRWPAVQHGRQGHRHQHGDRLADRRLDRHRLRHSLGDRPRRRQSATRVRRDAARLARRPHPAGHARTLPRASAWRARGALIAGVDDPGPAAAAGIMAGDVILSFDGTEIDAVHSLPRLVADEAVGKDVPVVVLRERQGADPDGEARPAR